MKIMMVGGGSGGHLTPLIAVAQAIKQSSDNKAYVVFVGQKNEGLKDVVDDDSIDEMHQITAGKFRRYHGESFFSHLIDIKTIFFNIRDFFRFIRGTVQAWFLLGRVKPDSILLKGGFVCVPIGVAARLRSIPYITHDSDAIPGLANRLTAKHAKFNTTAMPKEIYPYDQSKTIQVGIPLRPEFKHVDKKEMLSARKKLKINENSDVILSVGGGLGAQKINKALVKSSKDLLSSNSKLEVLHLTGKKLFKETKSLYESQLSREELSRVNIVDFTTDIHLYSSAANIVITRAGATNIAEFSVQSKPCIVIPNPVLTGGQQLHNAKVLKDANAAVILDENSLDKLTETIENLMNDQDLQSSLSQNIRKLSIEHSDKQIADLLLNISNSSS